MVNNEDSMAVEEAREKKKEPSQQSKYQNLHIIKELEIIEYHFQTSETTKAPFET